MTKIELSRVVICELYAMDHTPPADNVNVVTMAKTHRKATLLDLYGLANKSRATRAVARLRQMKIPR